MTDEKIETINVSSEATDPSDLDPDNVQEQNNRFGGPPMEEAQERTRVRRRRSPSGSRRPVVRRPEHGA